MTTAKPILPVGTLVRYIGHPLLDDVDFSLNYDWIKGRIGTVIDGPFQPFRDFHTTLHGTTRLYKIAVEERCGERHTYYCCDLEIEPVD